MKLMKQTAALMMLTCLLFTSCKKSNVVKDDASKFDINNPVGYFIYGKQSNDDGTWAAPFLFEFRPGKTLKFYEAALNGNGSVSYPYDIIDGNVVGITGSNIRFVIENGKITTDHTSFKELALIKAPETNQLAGKTFAGTYYNADKSVLHQKFFYSFASGENKVGAGFNIGTVMRTENYVPIGNIAAWVDIANSNDVEFMVLVNGKLEVAYYQTTPYTIDYGSFTPQ